MIESINQIYEAVLEAFTGIVQGMNGKRELIAGYIESIMEFIVRLAANDNRSDVATIRAVGLIG